MPFRDFATTEATELLNRLLASRSELSRRELQGLRQALAAAAQAAETALGNPTATESENEIVSALVERLSAMAAAQVEAAVSRVSAEADAASEVLRQQLAEQVNRHAALEAALREAREQADALALELQIERSESEATRAELGQAREAQTHAETLLRASEASWQKDTRAKEAAERELHTLREALDVLRANYAGMSKQLDTKAAEAKATNETLERELAEQTNAVAEIETSAREARAQADALAKELQTAKQQSEAAGADLARTRESQTHAEAALRAAEALGQKDARAREAAERELRMSREALDALRTDFSSMSRQLDASVSERTDLAASFRAAQEQVDTAEAGRQALAAELAQSAARVEALDHARTEHERARHELDAKLQSAIAAEAAMQLRTAEIEAELTRWRAEAERASTAASQAAVELERAMASAATPPVDQPDGFREHVVAAVSQPLDGLLAAYRQLAASKTIGEVLAALVDGLARDFARVALFTVKQDQLEGVQQVGFESGSDIINLVVPLNRESLLTEAVRSGRVQGRTKGALTDTTRSLFGGNPDFVLVVPITIHGKVLAVVYADDSDRPPTDFTTPEQRVKFAQLLLCLAVSRMPRLLMESPAVGPPREHAASGRP